MTRSCLSVVVRHSGGRLAPSAAGQPGGLRSPTRSRPRSSRSNEGVVRQSSSIGEQVPEDLYAFRPAPRGAQLRERGSARGRRHDVLLRATLAGRRTQSPTASRRPRRPRPQHPRALDYARATARRVRPGDRRRTRSGTVTWMGAMYMRVSCALLV